MRVIAVDDESLSLEYLMEILNDTPSIDEVHGFLGATEALDWLKENIADIAFLDIEMAGMNGIELAEQIGDVCPNCQVVFVTAWKDYAVDAFRLHASGYLVKPATIESVQREIEHIRELYPEEKKNRLKVQCFGNFEIFCDGKPIKFKYNKTKELFAYLVHRRGVAVSVRELVATLYEDRPDSDSLQSQLRTLVSDLTKTMNELEVSDLIVRERGSVAIKPDNISCDYYDFIDGDKIAAKSFMGEYMAQYDWAEYTVGYLERNY